MLLALFALVVCCFAPGFLFVRRLLWGGLEKLCGSIALSLILLWLGSWTVYVFASPAAYYGLAAACLLAAAVTARDTLSLFRSPRVRRAAGAYAILLAWTFLVLAVIRNYSGALWFGDWIEHFHRTLFFLHKFPTNTPIYGDRDGKIKYRVEDLSPERQTESASSTTRRLSHSVKDSVSGARECDPSAFIA